LPGSGFGISPLLTRRSVFAACCFVVLAVAGCGSESDEPSTASTEPAAAGGGTIVAALGDSITAGSPGYDPDRAERSRLGFGGDERSQFEYWAERADPGLEVRNCGVFGERTDQIRVRLAGCAKGADALIVQGGINDIAQGRPVPAAARDLRSMVRRGERLGLDVYLADLLPWTNGHPLADPPIARLNELIERIGREEEAPVLGFHDALENPGEPGTMRPRLTADGDHPSIAGYRRLGELVAERIGD
jgi:lysophospholipase L1-like esterase